MCSKILFVVLTLYFVANFSNGQTDKKFFRNDYQYVESTQSFYKIHTLSKTWRSAKRTCELEGAKLFYPQDDKEAEALLALWRKTQSSISYVFVGITDRLATGIYETIDGNLIDEVYHKWNVGEPDDVYSKEHCVMMYKAYGTYYDDSCHSMKPFICKKSLVSLEWNNECNMPNLDYKFIENLGRCYKFHLKPQNWTEAHAICRYEKSYLAVINSKQEADYLTTLTGSMPKKKINDNFMPGVVLLGFHDRYEEGWETIQGTSLEDSGYSTWANGQSEVPLPGSEPLPTRRAGEQCGSMLYNGQLNEVRCDKRAFFICEHEVDNLASGFNYRTGDRKH